MFTRARLQLTAWYAAAFAVIMVAIGIAAYAVVRQDADDSINSELRLAAEDILRSTTAGRLANPRDDDHYDDRSGRGREIRDDGDADDDDTPASPGQAALPPPGISSDVFYLSTTADGAVAQNPRQVDLEGIDFEALAAAATNNGHLADTNGGSGSFRFVSLPLDDTSGRVLHVGRSLDARNRQLRTLALTLAAGGMAGLLLSIGGGYSLAGRTLRPIRESMELQRRFISDASHELRTPIATIKANNELLLRHPEQTIEANLDQVAAVDAESDQMAKLVNRLLMLARADEGKLTATLERLDLATIAGDVVRDMTPLAEARTITVQTGFAPSRVVADSGQVRQLAAILIDNAIKYTPPGGAVAVRTGVEGRRAFLAVTDSGPGIAPEHQPHIFDRFYRVDSGRARVEGGSGLGLAIARSITELHHGRITLTSTLGKGSTFTVRLPMAD